MDPRFCDNPGATNMKQFMVTEQHRFDIVKNKSWTA